MKKIAQEKATLKLRLTHNGFLLELIAEVTGLEKAEEIEKIRLNPGAIMLGGVRKEVKVISKATSNTREYEPREVVEKGAVSLSILLRLPEKMEKIEMKRKNRHFQVELELDENIIGELKGIANRNEVSWYIEENYLNVEFCYRRGKIESPKDLNIFQENTVFELKEEIQNETPSRRRLRRNEPEEDLQFWVEEVDITRLI